MGKVTFVGGGPYDCAYLSMAAKEALQCADVVLYDHLLHEDLLELCNGTCIYVGKTKGHHSWRQEDINALLVEKAMIFDHVVRLKGGDSFVFGRGGEEAMELRRHQIPFTFIPGISSVIAATEMAGIPLTYRGISKGFQVLSAHLKDHSLGISHSDVQNPEITQVILMGVSRVDQICNLFLEAGRDSDTPIAIISKGCSYQQQVVCATLSTMKEQLKVTPCESPAIIVVGNVVNLRNQLKFFEAQPFFGTQILVTKVQKEESPLTHMLKQMGAEVRELQLGEIQSIPFTLEETFFQESHTLIFTSRNAIVSFFETYFKHYDIRALHAQSFLVMGEKTSHKLHEYGIQELAHAGGSKEQLITLIEKEVAQHHSLLYCKGKNASSIDINGSQIAELIVYENQPFHNHARVEPYDAICFSCASNVERYPYSLENVVCVSIGPTTTKALQKRNVKQMIEAKTPSYEAMIQALTEAWNRIGEV